MNRNPSPSASATPAPSNGCPGEERPTPAHHPGPQRPAARKAALESVRRQSRQRTLTQHHRPVDRNTTGIQPAQRGQEFPLLLPLPAWRTDHQDTVVVHRVVYRARQYGMRTDLNEHGVPGRVQGLYGLTQPDRRPQVAEPVTRFSPEVSITAPVTVDQNGTPPVTGAIPASSTSNSLSIRST